jgi:hypothetical protein
MNRREGQRLKDESMQFLSRARLYLIGCIAALALAPLGCRRRDPYTDGVLEITRAEKMDLEDQIYALEDKLAEKERELEALRARTPIRSSSPKPPRTRPVTPGPGVMDDSDLMPPMIDPGTPVEPKIEIPPVEAVPSAPTRPAPKPPVRTLKHSPAIDDTDLAPPKLSEPVKTESLPAPKGNAPSFRSPAAEPELVDPQVTNVFINPFHTTGVELDQQPGDDGIQLVLEPRNEAGQYVPDAGEMTIVALDPAAPGDAARVARWELSKTEVGKRLLASRGPGIKLQLKWPEKRPDHGKLKLFVRYQSAEGRTIESQSDVFITLPGQISQRWTPRRE